MHACIYSSFVLFACEVCVKSILRIWMCVKLMWHDWKNDKDKGLLFHLAPYKGLIDSGIVMDHESPLFGPLHTFPHGTPKTPSGPWWKRQIKFSFC